MPRNTKNKKEELMHEHEHQRIGHAHRGKGVVFIVIGLIFAYIAYTWNPSVTLVIVSLAIAAGFLCAGAAKLGYGMFGCCCAGYCDCE